MSGDDLRVTTAHLSELTVQQVRAAAETRSATFAVEGVDAAVRSTHGIIASATAGAVSAVVAARRSAAMKMATISDDLSHKLADAARRYDQSDDAMGRALHSILDVTIVYPGGRPTMLDLFADRVSEVRVHIRELPIPDELLGGDYQNDPAFRERAQGWLNEVWVEKDRKIANLSL